MKIVALLGLMLSLLDGTSRAMAIAPDGTRNPVILVHGILSDASDMQRMANYLRSEGWEVHTPTLTPSNGRATLETLADQLASYIQTKIGKRRFDLVAFSMGGLVSRYYLQRLGGTTQVDQFITLAAPHHGTVMAKLSNRPGTLQMHPGSKFLRDLDSDADKLRTVRFTSFYTPLDTIIVPCRSSEMPQARNVRMWAAIHPSLILEKRCCRAVAKLLRDARS